MAVRSLLLVVDLQVGLLSREYGPRSSAPVVANVARLVTWWRQAGWPVAFTRHLSTRRGSPLEPGQAGCAIEPLASPREGEAICDKTTNSAFKAPSLAAFVAEHQPTELVVAGLATDACITATAREAKDLGYSVTVLSDACATFERRATHGEPFPADLVHEVALAALQASGIAVRTTSEQIEQFKRAD